VTLDSNSQAIGFGIVLLAIVVGSMIYTKGEAETVAPSCVTSEERIIIRAARCRDMGVEQAGGCLLAVLGGEREWTRRRLAPPT